MLNRGYCTHHCCAGKRKLSPDLVYDIDLADIPPRSDAFKRNLQLHGDRVGARSGEVRGRNGTRFEGLHAFRIEQTHADVDLARLEVLRVGRGIVYIERNVKILTPAE